MAFKFSTLLVISLFLSSAFGDGDHAHAHETPSSQATVTTVQSTSGDSGTAFASIAKVLEDNPTLAAAAAAALGGGGAGRGGYSYPPPPAQGAVPGIGHGGYGGGYPSLFPWGLGGFGKDFHLNFDAGAGLGGIGAYYPIIEKAIVIVGGGILVLLIIAFIQGSLTPGGFLHSLGGSFSKAVAGAASIDIGPIHQGASGAASFSANDNIGVGGGYRNDPYFNQNVANSINRRY